MGVIRIKKEKEEYIQKLAINKANIDNIIYSKSEILNLIIEFYQAEESMDSKKLEAWRKEHLETKSKI